VRSVQGHHEGVTSDPGRAGDRLPPAGDILQFGRPIRSRRYQFGTLLLAGLVAAAVVLVVVRAASHRVAASPPPVTVTSLGQPILGVRADWQLIGFDGRGVVAIQFARGRIVRTTIPRLAGDGIVSVVPAVGEVLVRPLDDVPGYLVPDGKPAEPLTGVLAHGGYLLPGPTPGQQWLDSHDLNLVLVGPDGKPERAHLPESALLRATQVSIISDGRGGFILAGASGTVYDANNGALQMIPALPLAVGPRNWLGLRCDNSSCRNVVISAATGESRTLPGPASYAYPWPWQALPGAASPDGAAAAVIVPGNSDGQAGLDLVSLTSGTVQHVHVPVAGSSSGQSLAWSPDSRWLFVVTARGRLAIVDARTGQPRLLSLGLSGLSQIVIRPAAG
jgi:hypothetical protein